MNSVPSLCCETDEERRALTRKSQQNGLDYVEVSCDQKELSVYFLGKAPSWKITEANLRIDGGQRVRGIRVISVDIERSDDEGIDDVMHVRVDRPGDFSTYTLCMVRLDPESGRPTNDPPMDFDPRYACVCFSFKSSCATDLDCGPVVPCDDVLLTEPAIDYLAKDYATFRRLILDRIALLMPEWTERHIPDIGITLVELLAYVGDQLSYYQDAVATEAYLDTARLRISVRRHARLVDYVLHEGCNARAWIVVSVSQERLVLNVADFSFITGNLALGGNVLKQADLLKATTQSWLVFEPMFVPGAQSIELWGDHNEIHFYTWNESECCIPKGTTSATLIDPGKEDQYRLQLKACDVLVFEEVLGPGTTAAADADRTHRHAVRLTRVTRTQDPLTKQLLVDIEWCKEDALPFPLCLSVIGPPPECKLTTNISVARGNVLLVDHGQTFCEDLCPVPGLPPPEVCADNCLPAEAIGVPDRYAPKLKRVDITHASVVEVCHVQSERCEDSCSTTAASLQLIQDCRNALPCVSLKSGGEQDWSVRGDLLNSGPDDTHFVVETDDDRGAHLRFGDDDCGRHPEVGETFHACYRVGNGVVGNVGAEVIVRMVFRDNYPGDGVRLTVRNPLPAQGGTAPESVAEAKLRAPFVFRNRLERAITADDYSAIVERDFATEVQRAAAQLCWNGICPEVVVAVDAVGSAEPSKRLLARIARYLRAYRRIGHDVHVIPARQVSLDIALTICVKSSYLRGHVKAAVLAALSSRKLANGKIGFFHPDNLTFGEGVYVSSLVATVQPLTGVESVVVTKLERLDVGANGELAAGVLPLAPMEVARLDGDPNFPEHGVLTLSLKGGR